MSTISPRRRPTSPEGLPPLENGERMQQPEFHRRYKDYPQDVKFELVGGVVYMASPSRWPHSTYHQVLGLVLGLYAAYTPGVEAGTDATTILGEESEPQPDLALRILPECDGQSRLNEEEYVEGAPELLAEIAYSSRSLDMNRKRQDYEQAGVQEYLVLCVEEQQLHWFHFPSRGMIRARRQGVLRSLVFPGLWLHEQALIAREGPRLIEIAQKGLATREHAAFVRRLEAARRRRLRD